MQLESEQEREQVQEILGWVGLLGACFVIAAGIARAFDRGGHDFSVFFTAWKWALSGQGSQIYLQSPDRFLYAPGFAWVFSFIALLPEKFALALWCCLKAGALGLVVSLIRSRVWPPTSGRAKILSIGFCSWSVLFLARPLLIDFEYGQINVFVMAASIWALLRHRDRVLDSAEKSEGLDFLAWMLLSILAVTKLFPLPLLLLPWVVRKPGLRAERGGVVLGVLLVLCLPLLSGGLSGWTDLHVQWFHALTAKGLPAESHNQSFTALLHHYFSGDATPVISESGREFHLGWALLNPFQIQALSLAWALSFLSLILAWILSPLWKKSRNSLVLSVCLVTAIILPSHLVWKPYFVFGIPAASLLAPSLLARPGLAIALMLVMNFTGFDWIGHEWGPRLEAASVMLFAYLVLLMQARGRLSRS